MVSLSVKETAWAKEVPDLSLKGSVSVTVKDPDTGEPVSGGALTIYQAAEAAEKNGDFSYVLTEEFADMEADLSDPGDEKLAGDLEDYALQKELQGTEKEIAEDGTIIFQELSAGLYLIVQTKPSENYYPVKSFLVSVPMKDEETGSWIYEVDAAPKMETESQRPGKPVDLTVKKVWEGGDKSKHPDNVTVGLYKKDTLVEKITLNDANHWTYTWKELDGSVKWKIQEIDVPKGYAVSYRTDGFEITITNTASLIQTGQLNWPVPLLAFTGLALVLTGIVLLGGKRKRS